MSRQQGPSFGVPHEWERARISIRVNYNAATAPTILPCRCDGSKSNLSNFKIGRRTFPFAKDARHLPRHFKRDNDLGELRAPWS